MYLSAYANVHEYIFSFHGITGTVSYNHTNGCQKCEVSGEYDRKFRKISYPNLAATRRTDETFRQRNQISHHKEDSPLEYLNIDMINAFPISDPLHLLHQGVIKNAYSVG